MHKSQLVREYIKSLHNPAKKLYAALLFNWYGCGKPGTVPERPRELSVMAWQAVLLKFREIDRDNGTESSQEDC